MATYHTVDQGECLDSIAKKYGFTDYRTIYNHAKNALFKQERPNPNIIYPGDSLFIPDKEERIESRPTDQRHPFQLTNPHVLLRLILKDKQGQPFANKRVSIIVEGQSFEGNTDASGLLEQKISSDARAGELSLWLDESAPDGVFSWNLRIGCLDPVEKMTGIQARLNNLGYESGPIDGIQGPITTRAVKEFQKENELKVDGIPGPLTQGKLKELHGC
jgi:hypothetical protein